MNKYGIAALVALLSVGCQKQTTEESSPTPESTPAPAVAAPKPASAAAKAPAPGATAPVATAPTATPAPELAPVGVFYLIVPARIETADGIVGLPPGTGVKLVRPGVYLTPAGEAQLSDAQLTNDMNVARKARDEDRNRQSATKQQLAGDAYQAKAAAAVKAVETDASHQAAVNNMERQRLEMRIEGLSRQEKDLSAQQRALTDKRAKESFNANIRGRTVASTTEQQLNIVATQLDGIRKQINDARVELANKR